MPRNISFALTKPQFRAKTKTVTRRVGWKNARAGEVLCGVEKAQGLKKGEKIVRLGYIEVVSARREPLSAITDEEIVREGFPEMSRQQFIDFFCSANRTTPDADVTRIEYKYL